LRILFVPIPSLRSVAIRPYGVDSVEFYSQNPFFDGLDTPAALQDREWHAWDEEGQHLVSHTPLEEVALL